MKLNVKAFALASGLVWGFGIFFATWWLILVHGAGAHRTFLGWFYLGYHVSPLGSVIGLIWGFFDALVCGAIFAWLYNRFCGKAASE